MNKLPSLKYEKKLWRKGYIVIGVDEVGRGAFAGPLVLGGVVFKPSSNRLNIKKLESLGINDSKKLNPIQREKLSKIIKRQAFYCFTSSVSVRVINKKNISIATQIGVRKIIKHAQKQFPYKKIFLLMDAFYIKYIQGVGLKNQKAIIHGDEISLSIAAASIIAKVKRDKYMTKLSGSFPSYKWNDNKGYGTKSHRTAIKSEGITIYHRHQWVKEFIGL